MKFFDLLREPLTHFFFLAAILFGVEQFFAVEPKPSILIDAQTAAYLIEQQEDLELRVLSASEREETISAYIEDEILYREAYRRGLDQGDSRMRRNLILKMRGLLTGDLGEPTDADLRAYFDTNRQRFTRPPALSLEQVYFEDPAAVPEELRAALNGGLDPATVGVDSIEMQRTLPDMTQRYIIATFGSDAARTVVTIDDDLWHGPLESSRGVHFVRVLERIEPVQVEFDSVRQYLQGEWLMNRSRRAIRAEVERLRADYLIVIESGS